MQSQRYFSPLHRAEIRHVISPLLWACDYIVNSIDLFGQNYSVNRKTFYCLNQAYYILKTNSAT